MRILVAVSTATCLLGSSLVYAQDVPMRETDRGSGILASAKQAALRVELQPNAAPQRTRRRGRLYGGLTLVAIGVAVAVVAGLSDPGREYFTDERGFYSGHSDTKSDVANWTVAGGLGLAGLGGVMMVLADSTSRIRVGDGKPNEPLRSWRSHVVPLAGKGPSTESLEGETSR